MPSVDLDARLLAAVGRRARLIWLDGSSHEVVVEQVGREHMRCWFVPRRAGPFARLRAWLPWNWSPLCRVRVADVADLELVADA